MKNRIIIAALLLPVVIAALMVEWNDQLLWAVLVSVACSIAVLELLQMLRPYRPYVPAALVPVAVTPLLCWKAVEIGIFAAMVLIVPLIVVFASLSVRRPDPAASILVTLGAAAYVIPAAGLAVVLRAQANGWALVLLMLAGIWANDTAAYLVGRMWGRRKLAPRISPNKTVEGFIGGLVAGTFVVWYGHFLDKTSGPHWIDGRDAFLVGLAVALATPIGDLFESMVKRAVNVKDSSTLLGEHGGMLDRIDSILFAAPVMYVACVFTGVF